MEHKPVSFKQRVGVLLYDVIPFLAAILTDKKITNGNASWLYLCNRIEKLTDSNEEKGVLCDWQWSSELHACNAYPALGSMLMRKVLAEWPVKIESRPNMDALSQPKLSFIIGHRGLGRLPHLMATLGSIAGQRGVEFECIVVEQSNNPEIKKLLPEWVRYVHTPLPDRNMAYCRSWAFNVGALAAGSDNLVFHDNDILIPQAYAAELLGLFERGYEFIDLKRFIFYLSEASSKLLHSDDKTVLKGTPDYIVQNAVGGTIAAKRSSFMNIGGFDESFIGWGGEDDEFWGRVKIGKVFRFTYLPFLHIWHQPQSGKVESDNPNIKRIQALNQSVEERIDSLKKRGFGELDGPSGYQGNNS